MTILLTMVAAFVVALLLTPIIKRLSIYLGAVDKPNHRKVHERIMPRMGGLAIYAAFVLAYVLLKPESEYATAIMIGASIIVLIGLLDDFLEISAKAKVAGQLLAAGIVVFYGGLDIDFINLPFGGTIDFGYLSIPLTILWIIGITNAINLIDGLDGLAAGVSTIALITLAVMAGFMDNFYVVAVAAILAASCAGFLVFNFHPAKIFMGDTGSLFLGFMISVLALTGFKNVTVISLVIPIIILGVPISDTFFAIVRRIRMRQPISAPDKSHLHHCLLRAGFSHRQTVLIIYSFAALFGLAAILFSQATVWGAFLIIGIMLLVIELFVEIIGLAGQNYYPILKLVKVKK